MYTENFKRWAGIDDTGLSGTPWGILAIKLIDGSDISQDRAMEAVVLHCLKQGESRPLAQLFQLGISPSPPLLKHIGVMLAPDGIPEDTLQKHCTFGLKVCEISQAKSKRPRSRTDKKHPFVQLQEELIRENVAIINEEGSCYEAAIEELAQLEGLKKETVRSSVRHRKE